MGETNFTQCGIDFMSSPVNIANYGWNGSVRGIPKNQSTQISLEGCRALCGTGNMYYKWSQASDTITTWILPVLGVLLQAPFESNAFRKTVWAIGRWVGSPMASLSYILWNIKVSGKCALMVDMAIPYDAPLPDEESDWSSIRDSFYILMTMNQYSVRDKIAPNKKEAEGLLRIVLFSKDLRLKDSHKSLKKVRQEFAAKLRRQRKRGVVPVFVSTAWFIFSLAISIQGAFGFIGENATAHDLALGLLLAWLPVLILSSIVDRNPVAADEIKRKLNKLVESVRSSLQDDEIREEYINTLGQQSRSRAVQMWVEDINYKAETMHDFFDGFAGQGRVRWHYGVAHPILSDIEAWYVAERGRGWLHNEEEARFNLVLGKVSNKGLMWFDARELWQITASVVLVGLSCLGAFILSYYTPTVGLGCRSGGYTIFVCMTFGLLVCEMFIWWIASPLEKRVQWIDRTGSMLRRNESFANLEKVSIGFFQMMRIKTFLCFKRAAFFAVAAIVGTAHRLPLSDKESSLESLEGDLHKQIKRWSDFTLQEWSERIFFRPVELVNACWLIYIIIAQTFGIYRNCKCMTSTWGGEGGYLDFSQWNTANSDFVARYWLSGTILASTAMGIAMTYVVVEWCMQSHLSTEDYDDARQGLRRTRRFRRVTFPIRQAVHIVIKNVKFMRSRFLSLFGIPAREGQRSLIWTHDITWTPKETETDSLTPSDPTEEIGLLHPDVESPMLVELNPLEPARSRMPRIVFTQDTFQRGRSDSDRLTPGAGIGASSQVDPLTRVVSGVQSQRSLSPGRSSMRTSYEGV